MIFHRNSQKRIYEENSIYFVTVNTFEKFPYFWREEEKDIILNSADMDPRFQKPQPIISQILCELWEAELRLAKQLKPFELYAFCLNSDHFHLLLKPTDKTNISEILHNFKRNFSRDANRILESDDPYRRPLGTEPTSLPECLKPPSADMDPRFRNRLRDLDEKISEWHRIAHSPPNKLSFPLFRWQKSFHDHLIRDEQDFENHWQYTTDNYLKHGLPKDWKWTSERFLQEKEFSPLGF